MKVAYITAGAAGMYCGSCINDNALAGALTKLGHDVVLLPTYTPTRTDVKNFSNQRVFLGGINAFLDQKSPRWRKAPGFMRWMLDRPMLLRAVSKFSDRTKAEDLGSLTESMLLGLEGPHSHDLNQLASWLQDHFRPDLVHITNSMFLGVGVALKRSLNCRVVCSLQGEDLFLDDLIEPYKSRVFELLRTKAKGIDRLIATATFYADFMAEHVGFDRADIDVVSLGVDSHAKVMRHDQPILGFFARQSPEKGLDLLVDAFIEAKQHVQELTLRVGGYVAQKDRQYVDEQRQKIAAMGLQSSTQFHGELDLAQKRSFLGELTMMALPTRYREPKGLSVMESMASGLPVILPRHGVFPELLQKGGGLLVEPLNHDALVTAIVELARDPAIRASMGAAAAASAAESYSLEAMARGMSAVYEDVMGGRE